MSKIIGNTIATPIIPKIKEPYIPKSCDMADNAVWSFEFCETPVSTEGMRSLFYTEGSLNFFIEIDSSAYDFVNNTIVFFNPKTAESITCYCQSYLMFDWGFEYEFINLERPLDVTTLEDFKKKYTHCGIYFGEYKWKSNDAFLGDVNKALDGILEIQKQLIGGDVE